MLSQSVGTCMAVMPSGESVYRPAKHLVSLGDMRGGGETTKEYRVQGSLAFTKQPN